MRQGFYTAVGTPVDQEGHVITDSLAKQINDQVECEASGLLVMGSMGLGVFVRDKEYVLTAKTSIQAAHHACPVFIGVTDTSIDRVSDRIDALKGLDIDGVVATAPYYYQVSDRELIRFYSALARRSPFPVYLYDLPVAARNKITWETMAGLKDEPNIKGIKTADWALALALKQDVADGATPSDFSVLYSGLDTFDEAYAHGVTMNLDGMFACTGPVAKKMYRALAAGDQASGKARLNDIVRLRNTFAEEQIFPSFTFAMNQLGYSGCFHPDYYFMPSDQQKEKILVCMRELKLL